MYKNTLYMYLAEKPSCTMYNKILKFVVFMYKCMNSVISPLFCNFYAEMYKIFLIKPSFSAETFASTDFDKFSS